MVTSGAVVSLSAAHLPAITIADINFDNGANRLENLGSGPDAVLLGGADVTTNPGQLTVDGVLDSGLDIPLAAMSPFSGLGDWSVSFSFATQGGDTGALFSSDGSHAIDPGEFPGGQQGSLNVYLSSTGEVVADLWRLGSVAVGAGLNDDASHDVLVSYHADEGRLTLDVDEAVNDSLIVGGGDGYFRDASLDFTRLGDANNLEIGGDIHDGFAGTFDNLIIDGPAQPRMKIIVNRDDGSLTLESVTPLEFTFSALRIESAAGSFAPSNWRSIAEHYDAGNPGPDQLDDDDEWVVEAATEFTLSENDGGGNGLQFESSRVVDLGTGAWRRSPLEDVRLTIFDPSLGPAGEDVPAIVEYSGAPLLVGDLDTDGQLDASDWSLFKLGFTSSLEGESEVSAYFRADLNVDGIHNIEDIVAFSSSFDAVNGIGAFAAMVGVPEPSGLAAAAAAIGLLVIGGGARCVKPPQSRCQQFAYAPNRYNLPIATRDSS